MKISLIADKKEVKCTPILEDNIIKVYVDDFLPNQSYEVMVERESYNEILPKHVYVCIEKDTVAVELGRVVSYRN